MENQNIAELMDKIQADERKYELEEMNSKLAMQMGLFIVKRVREMGKCVSMRITLNHRILFGYSMDDYKPEGDDWMRRKENLVYETNSSSYYWQLWVETSGHDLDWRGMSYADYAPAGGSFPLRVKGAGVCGAVTITGMAANEDHDLAFEAIERAYNGTLGIDLGDFVEFL